MLHHITVMPPKQNIEASAGETLLNVLRSAGFFVNAACGGNGSCGKCKVLIDGKEALACRTVIDRDMTVTLPSAVDTYILTEGITQTAAPSSADGFCLAFDIGTTTVVGYLLSEKNGQELARESTLNPQASYGADVISRIQYAIHGHMEELTAPIRKCVTDLACRMGLLPAVLEPKITAVGNAAGSGAKMLACNKQAIWLTQNLVKQVEFIELASAPAFRRCFAQNMRFCAAESYWCQKAVFLGFSKAIPLNVDTLQPRQDVRDMCAADKCGAYGKNWTCPPYCGTLAECSAKIQRYAHGILLQTVGITEKTIDTKAYRRTEEKHLEQFHTLCEQIRKIYPDALCLGSGARRLEIRQDKNYGNDPEYQKYVTTVPILLPFIPLYSVKKHKWLVA